MQEGWRLQVAELRMAKRDQEALALIRQAIDEGDMSARVLLAKMGDSAGLPRSEVDQMIADVESDMDPKDIETHLQLRGPTMSVSAISHMMNKLVVAFSITSER